MLSKLLKQLTSRAASTRDRDEILARQNTGLERHDRLRSVENPLHSAWVRMYVWRRDHGKCTQCGNSERVWFDYIIPPWQGGSTTEQNIRLLCEHCSRNKSVRIWRRKLGA